ncbi:MAG: pyridine nucleotide-disulfide oxidoreductase [Sandaracinus sp.]|nr:pyridine nucleotide-disulfide oxidoreductase [Sandaracinus sp.]
MSDQPFDAVLIGGGPANLSAALALGRARRHVLLTDAGPRRNGAATHVNNFLTRDHTPPDEMRRIGREQLAKYPTVTLRDEPVLGVSGERGAFRVELPSGVVDARRLLLGTGMIDEMLPIEGFAERWGHAIYQCPYCHGYEVRDRPWGFLVSPQNAGHFVPFALQALQWTDRLTVFTHGQMEVDGDTRGLLEARGIRLATAPIERLVGPGTTLTGVATGGEVIPCDALYAHPPQRQVQLVGALGLELDDDGYVRVDEMRRETSRPGIYAAGDLTTRMQGAILAAGFGTRAAAMINVELAMEPH